MLVTALPIMNKYDLSLDIRTLERRTFSLLRVSLVNKSVRLFINIKYT